MTPVAIISTTQGMGHGAEEVLCQLLRAWRDSERSREALTICAPCNSRALLEADSLGYRVVPLRARRDAITENVRASLAIRRELRDCAVLHAWSARGFELATMLARLNGALAAGTLHDHPRAYFLGRTRRALMQGAANQMQALVCVSRSTRDECERHGYRVQISVIHNGSGDPAVAHTQRTVRSPVHVGFLGMNAEGKGFDTVADWIRREDPRMVWHLFGDVDAGLDQQVARVVEESQGRVILEGRQTTDEIFSQLDVLVHASHRFYETFGMVLIEAAQAGIPSVATRAGGPREIVEDGKTGLLYAPCDADEGYEALRRLVNSPDLRQSMGAQARARWEECFTAPAMAGQYAAFWEDLTGKGVA